MFSGRKRFLCLLFTLLVFLLGAVSCVPGEMIPTKVEELRGC